MLSKIQMPKTKQELIRAMQSASFKSVAVYEGANLGQVPSKSELARMQATVIILR